jgi:sarcosine oxidase, subunit beta
MMAKEFNTVVIGGDDLVATVLFRLVGNWEGNPTKVAIIEKKVLGAGLSSRHSAIVRSQLWLPKWQK